MFYEWCIGIFEPTPAECAIRISQKFPKWLVLYLDQQKFRPISWNLYQVGSVHRRIQRVQVAQTKEEDSQQEILLLSMNILIWTPCFEAIIYFWQSLLFLRGAERGFGMWHMSLKWHTWARRWAVEAWELDSGGRREACTSNQGKNLSNDYMYRSVYERTQLRVSYVSQYTVLMAQKGAAQLIRKSSLT